MEQDIITSHGMDTITIQDRLPGDMAYITVHIPAGVSPLELVLAGGFTLTEGATGAREGIITDTGVDTIVDTAEAPEPAMQPDREALTAMYIAIVAQELNKPLTPGMTGHQII